MRGDNREPDAMFSYILPAQRVPKNHPLWAIRTMVDEVLGRLWSDFEKVHSHTGRPSIPPERLLRALLLQVLYSIRSERMLMEQLDYNPLFRWFVGLSMDDRIWDPRRSPKIGTGCFVATSPSCSSIRCWPKPGSVV
jgi:transposase